MSKQRQLPPREPLLNRASITAIVGLVVAVLAVFGVHVAGDLPDRLIDVLVLATPVVSPIVLAWWSRRHVTPVADPRAEDGTRLVKALPL